MFDQEYNEQGEGMREHTEMGCMLKWPKKFKKEFMMAKLKKKEKMLEAKLEFIREMRRLAEKIEMENGKEIIEEEKE